MSTNKRFPKNQMFVILTKLKKYMQVFTGKYKKVVRES